MTKCIRCEKTDLEIPLLQMWYQGREIFICPQCLPVLIHKPSQLADKLPDLRDVQPPQHEH